MYILKKYGSQTVYKVGALSALFVALLFITIALGWITGLWPFLIIVGIFALVFGMMAPLGMKSSLSAFRSVSGVAAALQSATLFIASALGSAAVGLLMHFFHALSAEAVFAMISALLCLIAAGTALKSKTF